MPQQKSKNPKKYYAVAIGRTRGIFTDWELAKQSVNGFQGNLYKAFATLEEAEEFLNKNHEPPRAFQPFTVTRKHYVPPPKLPEATLLSQVPRSEHAPRTDDGVEETLQASNLGPTESRADRQSDADNTPRAELGIPEAHTGRDDADEAKE